MKFHAAELSNALFADIPLSAILISYITLLRDCGEPEEQIENMLDLFINPVALCNAYFALGGNAGLVCFVVRILVAVAARKVVVPADLHADQIVFDVPVNLRVDQDTD